MSRQRPGSVRVRSLVLATAAVAVAATSALIRAQAPPAAAQTSDPLPVRRVVLYKSGVGYFEHLGRVRGNQTVTIDFTSGQLDDVLKSMTALDLGGGRVTNIGYNSEAGLERRLGALRLPIGAQTTRVQFLNALRGARLEVRTGATRRVGRLLSVEQVEHRANGAVTRADVVSLVSDAGEIQTIALDPGVSVRIVDSDLSEEVGKYLGVVASAREQDVRRMTITTAGTGDRDLFVSYVSEVPVWKATYRLVLPSGSDTRRPLLQGWAIVDNTVGEDWTNVEVSLVAGVPQTFVQPISRPYYVARPIVPLPDRFLLAPQTHQAAVATSGAGAIAGTVRDRDGGVIPGATVRVTRGGTQVGQAVTDRTGQFRLTGLSAGAHTVTVSLSGFKTFVASGVQVSGGMEAMVTAVLDVGALSESISVRSQSSTVTSLPQSSANVTLDGISPNTTRSPEGFFANAASRADAIEEVLLKQQADAAAAQLGDLFEYRLKEPVTIRQNQSALVPIVSSEVTAEKVSIWNAASGAARALRGVWLTNTTGNTLDGGSFSVIEGQAFAGEGLIEPLKAGERRLISYALDLGLVLDSKFEAVPTRTTKVQIVRGTLIGHTAERQQRTYSLRNEDDEARTVIVEHPARAGWEIGGSVMPAESTPAWHRYRVVVAPRTTSTFTVEETRPVQTHVSISAITDEQVTLLVRDKLISDDLQASLREVLTRKAEVARLASEAARRQGELDQIARDQERVRENMRALRGSSEERQLTQRYVRQLNEQETRIDVLRKEIADLQAQRAQAQAELTKFIEGLS